MARDLCKRTFNCTTRIKRQRIINVPNIQQPRHRLLGDCRPAAWRLQTKPIWSYYFAVLLATPLRVRAGGKERRNNRLTSQSTGDESARRSTRKTHFSLDGWIELL